ncbi:dnaJ homolog subfamily C member 3 [Galleria mellonella]|uniref:DnaJ homolog subfamily C member 3 n=1 Tax=Galleria mellonella TaxID=7137 RepID=A0ABM3MFB9_GALME|nr:dnaJ homolog subfamily C member 3 [Galleria mellonella]XP_052750108.1 dnaJ homolog subfamily C member 3 [Galleria mellonella]
MDYLVNINWNKVTPCLVLLVLEVVLEFSDCASPAEVNKHLELGRDFLARGQLSDALTHYHAAVEGDPHNYLTYFKRGTVYYALGKAKFALQDFTKVLELKADFTSARLQRANVYLKLAQYREAQEDYLQVNQADPYNEEAIAQYHKIEQYVEDLQLAEAYYRGGDHRAAADLASRLLEVSPWSAHLRQLRAEAYIALNDLFSAVSDIRSVNRLQQDSTDGYYRLATLLYQLGHVSDALKEIRECLKLDPEHKKCFPFYKKVKKVDKLLLECEELSEARDFTGCLASANKVLKVEDEVTLVVFEARRWLCSCSVKEELYTEALAQCSSALELRRDARLLCDRGDALLGLDMFDDAIHSFKEALELEEGLQRAKDGLSRAQKLQKQSEQRDYYKILGVKRSASKQEIIKAYRKAAQKWHPDNYQGDEKKIAEKKFIDIAAAKEVLTDAEKRAQFDAGSDPLDPEAGRAAPPFHSPFHHFQHGSPFQFKFHFN